ncbi:MAG: hypothetical protein QXW00_04460 [Candidatus Woesearchaeota archaeon]
MKWGNEHKDLEHSVMETAEILTLGILRIDKNFKSNLEAAMNEISAYYQNPDLNQSSFVKGFSHLASATGWGALLLGTKAVLYAAYWPVPFVYQNLIQLAEANMSIIEKEENQLRNGRPL